MGEPVPWPVESVETFPVPVSVGPLRAALARPRGGRACATVLLLQGRGEFLEKYGDAVSRLVAAGFVVFGFDWRGQGGSPRLLPGSPRGHIERFEDYLEDLACVLARVHALGLPRPLNVLAHSMGAHLALRWLAEDARAAERAALVAPMFDIDFRPLPRRLVPPIVALALRAGAACRYAFGQGDPRPRLRFAGNPATSCPEGFALWQELLARHPQLRIGGVTWGWLAAALRSIEALTAPSVLERISIPLLVFRAGADRVVSNRAIAAAIERLPRARLVDCPRARHDLFFERVSVRESVLRDVINFFAEETSWLTASREASTLARASKGRGEAPVPLGP